ncbi:hypothetical protein [Azospirillum sp.]|uniref:hypothetical protein n=1 Tax=Azospirillum sp. TaxID=34012 RepID=UPI002D34B893|nr:hypothetical protein [Azospirillum sp.]HYF86381.1 hypothetical protein [Azospirillum sp.]
MLLTLINHPTPAFTLVSKADPEERIFLGNVYRQTMPVSLARVAAIIEAEIGIDVNILDLKTLNPNQETVYKQVDLGDLFAIVTRIGAEFEKARDTILNSDWIGFSNHFTFESGIIRDLIVTAHVAGWAWAVAQALRALGVVGDPVLRWWGGRESKAG